MPDPKAIHRAPVIPSLASAFFSKQRHTELAIQQDLWIDLKAADLREKYEKGEWPTSEAVEGQANLHERLRLELVRRLFDPALMVLLCGIVAMALACLMGMPALSHAKKLGIAAGSVGLWAGLIQLDMPAQSWDAERLDEKTARAIVKLLVCLAAVLALAAGALP